MSHIFISYARKDIDFAGKIVQALANKNLDTWIDWKSIPKGEEWEQEIYSGIESADVFLFLISLDSVRSRMCNKEIVHAVTNGKRILPIVVRDTEQELVPTHISKLNWIFCRDGLDDFKKAIEEIHQTISTDYDWLRFHTELLVKALKWEKRKFEASLLLQGKDLEEAEAMFAMKVGTEPHPIDLQKQFVLQSRAAVNRQRRIVTYVSIGLAVIMLGLAIWGQGNAINATNQAKTAEAEARGSRARELVAFAQTVPQTLPERRLLLAISAIKTLSANDPRPPIVENFFRRQISNMGGIPLNGHKGKINVLAYSPDGQWLASGSDDETVRLWNANNLSAEPIILTGYKGAVNELFFSKNGRWLLSVSEGGTALRWDMKNLRLPNRSFQEHLIAFSSDGRWVVYMGSNGMYLIMLSDHQKEKDQAVLLDRRTPAPENLGFDETRLDFSPEKNFVVLQVDQSTAGSYLEIWDLRNPKEPTKYTEMVGYVYDLQFSPNDRWLVASTFWSGRNTLTVWNTNRLAEQDNLQNTVLDSTANFAFSHNGKWMVVKDGDRIRLMNIEHGIEAKNGELSPDPSNDNMVFSPDGRWLVTQSTDGSINLWNARDGRFTFHLFGPYETLRGLETNQSLTFAFSPNGESLSSGDENGKIRLWKTNNPRAIAIPLGDKNSKVVFSPSGKFVALGTQSGPIRLWTMQRIHESPAILLGHDKSVYSLAFSQDEHWLASSGGDSTLRLWDLQSPQPASVLIGKQITITSLAFSSDGDWLVSLSSEGNLMLWDVKNSMPEATKIDDRVSTFAISPDSYWLIYNQWLSSNGERGPIYLVDLSNPRKDARLLAVNELPSYVLAFSPDSHWLTSVSGFLGPYLGPDSMPASKLQVWDMKNLDSGPLLLKGQKKTIYNVTFTPDSKRLISVSNDGSFSWGSDVSVHVWDLPQATARFVRRLDPFYTMAFSPDTQWISIRSEHLLTLWDIQNPESEAIQLNYVGLASQFETMIFSPNNEWFLSESINGLLLWDLKIDDLVDIACQIVGRNFTSDEWKGFFPGEEYRAMCPQWPLEVMSAP